MTQFTVPPHNTVASLDVRGLSYVGPNPQEPAATLFQGPHGLPFEIAIKDVKDGRGTHKRVFLHGPEVTHPVNGVNGSISLSVRMVTIVCSRISNEWFAALPADHKARAIALRDLLASQVEPQSPVFTRGSLEEMSALLQAWSSLTDRAFRVMSAVRSMSHPRIVSNFSMVDWDTPFSIARWFKPVATQPDIKERPSVDTRVPTLVAEFAPQPLSGHDRLEAMVAVRDWLLAHYHEIEGHDESLEVLLEEIGAGQSDHPGEGEAA